MATVKRRNNRSIKNFLIDPLLQFKFGIYMVLTIIAFMIVVGIFAYYSLSEFVSLLIVLSEVPDSVREYLDELTVGFIIGLVIILVIFSLVAMVFVIVQTHRIVGASYAIKRHITKHLMNSDFDTKLVLRKKDYFKDIADALNKLSKKMKEKMHA